MWSPSNIGRLVLVWRYNFWSIFFVNRVVFLRTLQKYTKFEFPNASLNHNEVKYHKTEVDPASQH